jgi:hypothetical protein
METGDRRRSSYELAEVARRLGILSEGIQRWVVQAWPLVPLATVVAVGALVFFHGIASRLAAAVVALYVLVVAIIVLQAPVEVLGGTVVTAAGAALVLVSSLWWGRAVW